jgi:hypothetical protein
MWRIVRDLARVRATILAGGADRQSRHSVIGETVALMAVAKLHQSKTHECGRNDASSAFEGLLSTEPPVHITTERARQITRRRTLSKNAI